jgi:hypothetical protein
VVAAASPSVGHHCTLILDGPGGGFSARPGPCTRSTAAAVHHPGEPPALALGTGPTAAAASHPCEPPALALGTRPTTAAASHPGETSVLVHWPLARLSRPIAGLLEQEQLGPG